MAEAKEGGDARVKYIADRTATSFKHIKADKFKKAFETESNLYVNLTRPQIQRVPQPHVVRAQPLAA